MRRSPAPMRRSPARMRRSPSSGRSADSLAPALLPDRAAAIVTYCANPACPNSGQVADRLTSLGYTTVRTYREGIEDSVAAGLPTESAG